MKINVTHTIISILLGVVLLVGSCSKSSDAPSAPAACITAMADTATTGQSLIFASCTVGASSYIWNFGDGTSATTVSATHIYSAAGTYTITLTTVGANSLSSTKSKTIIVKDPPVPPYPVGQWTFENTNYLTATCTVSNGYIGAADASNSIVVQFYDSLSIKPGSYTVTAGTPANANQVNIQLLFNAFANYEFYYSNGLGTNQTAVVTVVNGKIRVAATNINVVSQQTSATAPLTFSLEQK